MTIKKIKLKTLYENVFYTDVYIEYFFCDQNSA